MSQEQYLSRVQRSIDGMPALPVTVAKVIEIANQPGTSPTDLNKVISVDPVLMARVMKLINSAYYGLNNKITSLPRAIIMLGLNTVKNLALSTAVVGNLGNAENFQALDPQGFWRHSLGVGSTAKLLAKRRKVDPSMHEEYFIAGLLHDIGKIPMNNVLADEFREAMTEAERRQISLAQAEEELLGFSHVNAGYMIGEAWRLQESVMEVIHFHHHPLDHSGNYRQLVYTVAAADYFMNVAEIGFSGNRVAQQPDSQVFEELGISPALIDDIEDDVLAQIQKAEVFLQVSE
jgi:putative nucleotidyltransferase with HDIG domain